MISVYVIKYDYYNHRSDFQEQELTQKRGTERITVSTSHIGHKAMANIRRKSR